MKKGFEGSRCQGFKGEEIGTEAQKGAWQKEKMRGKRRKAKSQRFKLEFRDV